MNHLHRLLAVAFAAIFVASSALAQNPGTVTNHAFAIGKGPGTTGYASLLCTSAQLAVGQAAADPICRTISGDATLSAAGAITLATVNANTGAFGSATSCVTVTNNAKGLTTAVSAATCTPAIGSITGLGTGIAAALAINTGSAGAPVLFNGAGGTPSSLTLTNATGLPVAGGGTGVATLASNCLVIGSVTSPVGCVVTNAGFSGLPLVSQGAAAPVYQLLSTGALTGTLAAARMPALTGDCTSTAGTVATTCTGINGVNQNAAWTAYTPLATAASPGITPPTIACTGLRQVIGKTVLVQADCNITAAGTGAGLIQVTLPFSASASNFVGLAKEYNTTGKSGVAQVLASTSQMIAADSTGTTFIATGAKVNFGITYTVP